MQVTATLANGLRRDPLTAVTMCVVLAICIVALIGPELAWRDPLATNTSNALRPPSWASPCGTDKRRDICARIARDV